MTIITHYYLLKTVELADESEEMISVSYKEDVQSYILPLHNCFAPRPQSLSLQAMTLDTLMYQNWHLHFFSREIQHF